MTKRVIADANEAVAQVAYATNDVIAIYPITPSSPMGESADAWMAIGRKNYWGTVPRVIEMESELGAAGVVHGSLLSGCLTTTFTASQGLLLMIPNMYKIAGELHPFCMHVAARSLATHALSIFGDHSDVMATRQTGFALLCSNNVQESHDFALIAQSVTLRARVPFLHFFDGFRTSHEVAAFDPISPTVMASLIDEELVAAHRARGLSPDHPTLRGTAQNPDVFFQTREAANPYYDACPHLVQDTFDRFAELTGRQYRLFEYVGAKDAEDVIVVMGSGAETVEEVVEEMLHHGDRVGVLKVRLYRPFNPAAMMDELPGTVRRIAVLDRTKEPGAVGEPLFQDVVTALAQLDAAGRAFEGGVPRVIGGRYGLSSKDFTPAMAKAIFEEMCLPTPRAHFTVGIEDDVTHLSLKIPADTPATDAECYRVLLYGLGSDGTVGAAKNTLKIVGTCAEHFVQGHFVYDSKKSGAITVSHLRFSPNPIRAHYEVAQADFIGVHQWGFLEKFDVLERATRGALVLLNAPFSADEVWDHLPRRAQEVAITKELRLYVLNADAFAHEHGLGRRINTVMQAGFFALSRLVEEDVAREALLEAARKSYGKMGQETVEKNLSAIREAWSQPRAVLIPAHATALHDLRPPVAAGAPAFVENVLGPVIAGQGDRLPVSAMPVDGCFPTNTARWEKRAIAQELPTWDVDLCIQCGKCVLACPHAAIRGKLLEPLLLEGAPTTAKSAPSKWPERKEMMYTLQVAPDDCTGCTLCVEVCPAKDKAHPGRKALVMEDADALRPAERENWEWFLELPEADRSELDLTRVKDLQLVTPYFEFSGACAGCGETPYLKALTQLFGDRMVVANATGCSSIFGGNLPTTPWSVDKQGRGPAWANSLFEDNAEFGLGMRVGMDEQRAVALELVTELAPQIGTDLAAAIVRDSTPADPDTETLRAHVVELRRVLSAVEGPRARRLETLMEALVPRSVWIVGGDGWAYDIGYGGLDHVMASGYDVNILVLDTEVYSNTGGQASKSTPRGAIAKFASAGKVAPKKDLALMAMSYGTVYVARIAMGANEAHTLRVMKEAAAWHGPSLIIAYSHCIAHGFSLEMGFEQQKAAVASGHWPLMRYNPAKLELGENPLTLDSKPPKMELETYVGAENRYSSLMRSDPEAAANLLSLAKGDISRRWALYEHLAAFKG